jgi:adenylate cyclase
MSDVDGANDASRSATAIAARGDPARVAVLPFVNMSADAENEYFSDGLTEEIINLLAGTRRSK